jgi:hypothetical protein
MALRPHATVKMSYGRKILLVVMSLAMVVDGLLVLAFGLLATGPGKGLFICGGPMLAFVGLYLLWGRFHRAAVPWR